MWTSECMTLCMYWKSGMRTHKKVIFYPICVVYCDYIVTLFNVIILFIKKLFYNIFILISPTVSYVNTFSSTYHFLSGIYSCFILFFRIPQRGTWMTDCSLNLHSPPSALTRFSSFLLFTLLEVTYTHFEHFGLTV